MPKLDKRIDAYIARSADFAKPILTHIRAVVHATCPDVEETLRWGMPSFTHHGILCQMAAFKAHAAFGFWKASLIVPADAAGREAMGSFGRLGSVKDLPSKRVLVRYIRKAMALNEAGIQVIRRKHPAKPQPKTPAYLLAALKKDKKALAAYEAFSPGMKREYVQWLEEAKTDATRNRRTATAVEWIAEGKPRNWKYQNC
jgi:hypothetical protein